MEIVEVNLTEYEKFLADSYAKRHGLSLEEAFKRALFEKIEDEYDIAVGEEAYEEYVQGGEKSRPSEEVWKELGMIENLPDDPFYSKENMEELERRVNDIRSGKSILKEHELIEELSDDPFYSKENMERLEGAAADAKAGRNMEEHDLMDE